MVNNYSWGLDYEYIAHYGVPHGRGPHGGSGRYPWGSGDNPRQPSMVKRLGKKITNHVHQAKKDYSDKIKIRDYFKSSGNRGENHEKIMNSVLDEYYNSNEYKNAKAFGDTIKSIVNSNPDKMVAFGEKTKKQSDELYKKADDKLKEITANHLDDIITSTAKDLGIENMSLSTQKYSRELLSSMNGLDKYLIKNALTSNKNQTINNQRSLVVDNNDKKPEINKTDYTIIEKKPEKQKSSHPDYNSMTNKELQDLMQRRSMIKKLTEEDKGLSTGAKFDNFLKKYNSTLKTGIAVATTTAFVWNKAVVPILKSDVFKESIDEALDIF